MGIWSEKHPQSFSETLLHFFKAGVYCGFLTEIAVPPPPPRPYPKSKNKKEKRINEKK